MKRTRLNALMLLVCTILITNATHAEVTIDMDTDTLKGRASYYSDALHGRRMSNGEKYNRDSMTCAHLKYPLGTMLKVKNLTNHKEVIVKVTDRGPHVKKYIIDLSLAAAKELNMVRAGFCMVEIVPWHNNMPPYLPEDEEEELPELDLNYIEAATYPEPAWQRDSVKTVHTNTRATVLPIHNTPDEKAQEEKKDTSAQKQADRIE